METKNAPALKKILNPKGSAPGKRSPAIKFLLTALKNNFLNLLQPATPPLAPKLLGQQSSCSLRCRLRFVRQSAAVAGKTGQDEFGCARFRRKCWWPAEQACSLAAHPIGRRGRSRRRRPALGRRLVVPRGTPGARRQYPPKMSLTGKHPCWNAPMTAAWSKGWPAQRAGQKIREYRPPHNRTVWCALQDGIDRPAAKSVPGATARKIHHPPCRRCQQPACGRLASNGVWMWARLVLIHGLWWPPA